MPPSSVKRVRHRGIFSTALPWEAEGRSIGTKDDIPVAGSVMTRTPIETIARRPHSAELIPLRQ